MPAAVRVDPTPNPNSLKLSVDRPVSAKAATYSGPGAADPLAAKLLALDGVRSVFMVGNFVTVTKDPAASWDALRGPLESTVAGHFDA